MRAALRFGAAALACGWMAIPPAGAQEHASTQQEPASVQQGPASAQQEPAAAREEAAQTPPTPVQLVTDLQNMQGRIAQGDAASYAAQPKLLRGIANAFSGMPPEVWKNSRNARAAVIYLLSGGQPRIVMHLLESDEILDADKNLMKGALAYVLGRDADALQILGEIDPRSLDPALGGQLAFIQCDSAGRRSIQRRRRPSFSTLRAC